MNGWEVGVANVDVLEDGFGGGCGGANLFRGIVETVINLEEPFRKGTPVDRVTKSGWGRVSIGFLIGFRFGFNEI